MPTAEHPPSTPRLTGREIAVTATVALNLVFLPWAFGGVDAWSQQIAALLATASLIAALWPRARHPASAPSPAQALWRFPVFWAGLAAFTYIIVQQLNPAFVYHHENRSWWLEACPFVGWLPAGMIIPFADAGPMRALLLWYPSWATVCALWIGVTRHRLVLTLLNVVAVSGFALAAFGLVQLAAGQNSVYGVRTVQSAEIFASFIYHNHAAAYFNLVAAVIIALALQAPGWDRAGRPGAAAHGPAVLYLLFALTVLAAVVMSFSLAGFILLLAAGAVLAAASLRRFRRSPGRLRVRWLGAGAALVLAGTVGMVAIMAGGTPWRSHLQSKLQGGAQQSLRSRLLADKRGFEMFLDRPLLGWGAGCFRYGFTKYQRRELEITGTGLARSFWEHQHNDWLELLIEFGVIGAIPFVVVLTATAALLVRRRFWRDPLPLWTVAGLLVLGAHALIDFPLQNPAILFTAACVSCLIARWSECMSHTSYGAVSRPGERKANSGANHRKDS